MSRSHLDGETLDVLLVCTGNMCRSPAAEAYLRHHLAGVGLDVVVHSAGLRPGGERPNREIVGVLRRRGYRIRGHRSTTLTRQMLLDADLVLGMAGEHVQAAAAMAPEVWPRLFTLKELIRRSDGDGAPRRDESRGKWLARIHSTRTASDLTTPLLGDDIQDPSGQPRATYEHMADEVDRLTQRLAHLLPRENIVPIGGEPVPPIGAESVPPAREPQADLWSETVAYPICSMVPGDRPDAKGLGPDEEKPVTGEADRTGGGAAAADGAALLAVSAEQLRLTSEQLDAARKAFQYAQVTVEDLGGQLAELLRVATAVPPAPPADAYRQLGEEVAGVLRSAAAHASAVRDEADRYSESRRADTEADCHAVREEASTYASEMRRRAEHDATAMRTDAEELAVKVTDKAHRDATAMLDAVEQEAMALRAEMANRRQHASAEVNEIRHAAMVEAATLRQDADDYAATTRSKAEGDAHETLAAADATYAELIAAEADLRERLEGAAGALVSALKGPLSLPPPPAALARADEASASKKPARRAVTSRRRVPDGSTPQGPPPGSAEAPNGSVA